MEPRQLTVAMKVRVVGSVGAVAVRVPLRRSASMASTGSSSWDSTNLIWT